MKLYHGSPRTGLKELIYSEELSRFGGDQKLLHGAGIYLTTSIQEANAYAMGGSIYLVDVHSEIFDATDPEILDQFIKQVENKIQYSYLRENSLIQTVIKKTLSGESSAMNFAQNINHSIANDEGLYNDIIVNLFDSDIDKCENTILSLFNYKFIKLNNVTSQPWVIGINTEESDIEILEEIVAD